MYADYLIEQGDPRGELAALVEAAAGCAASQPAAIRARLDTLLAELAGLAPTMPQERVAQELTMLVTRADVREELEEGLCLQLAEVLKREVPPMVETLNISRMVEEKINTLDILKVEGLLLGIMEEQFTYINLFGALLGALIGLVNLVVMGLH